MLHMPLLMQCVCTLRKQGGYEHPLHLRSFHARCVFVSAEIMRKVRDDENFHICLSAYTDNTSLPMWQEQKASVCEGHCLGLFSLEFHFMHSNIQLMHICSLRWAQFYNQRNRSYVYDSGRRMWIKDRKWDETPPIGNKE